MGFPADDPLMLAAGPKNLGQRREAVLLVSEKPAVMPVADTFMVRSAADNETADAPADRAGAAGRAAPRLDDLLGGDGGSRRMGSPIVPSGRIAGKRQSPQSGGHAVRFSLRARDAFREVLDLVGCLGAGPCTDVEIVKLVDFTDCRSSDTGSELR